MVNAPKEAFKVEDFTKGNRHSVELEWHTLKIDIEHILACSKCFSEVLHAFKGCLGRK